MTESKSDGKPIQAKEPVIRWDDSGIKNSYANACNVSSTREEIVLNFGLNQAWERPQQDVQVQLTNRIILSPYTAKRLALLLAGVIQQYETRFGKLDLGTAQAMPDGETGKTRTEGLKPHVVE